MKTNFTTIIDKAKTLISAHKVAAIVTASAIGVGAVATGVGIAVHNSNKTDKGQKDPPETTGKITETVDPADDTTIDMTAEPETTAPETEEPETTILETEEPETTAEPVTTEPETEPPVVTTAAPVVTEPIVTEPAYVGVTGITMDRYEVNMNVGETATVVATIVPWNANNKAITWASNNTAVATVDANGNIYGVGAGECNVTATSADNSTVIGWIKVVVMPLNAMPEDQVPDNIPETLPISSTNTDLPDLGGVIDDATKNLIEQHKISCRYGCGEQHSGYLINSVFGGECPHCGENIPANVCHDCVRDGQTPAW